MYKQGLPPAKNIKTMKTLFDTQQALKAGGFTYSLCLKPGDLSGTANYAIAVSKSYERVFPRIPTHAQIAKYVAIPEVAQLLASPKYAFGGWKNPQTGEYVLDVVELVPLNELGAYPRILQLIEERNQQCAFNLATGTEVYPPVVGRIPESVGVRIK